MVEPNRYVTITLSPAEVELACFHAAKACLGGASFRTTDSRTENLSNDQQAGQFGNLALSKCLTGSADLYNETRKLQNLTPRVSIGHSDLIGMNVDVKTRQLKPHHHLRSLDLLVAENERHKNILYVLALWRPTVVNVVHVIGWISEHDMFPEMRPLASKTGLRAYLTQVFLLHPMRNIHGYIHPE